MLNLELYIELSNYEQNIDKFSVQEFILRQWVFPFRKKRDFKWVGISAIVRFIPHNNIQSDWSDSFKPSNLEIDARENKPSNEGKLPLDHFQSAGQRQGAQVGGKKKWEWNHFIESIKNQLTAKRSQQWHNGISDNNGRRCPVKPVKVKFSSSYSV